MRHRARRSWIALLLAALAYGGWLARPQVLRRQGNGHPAEVQKPQGSRAPSVAAGTFLEGRVVGVSDGDTITVLEGGSQSHRVRMLGIDAPEKAQPYGKVAKQVLADRIMDRTVRLRVHGRDRYQRLLATVYLGNEDQNLRQIQEGLAWHYADYARSQPPGEADRYAAAEVHARQAGIGLWRLSDPTPPWRWRRERRSTPKGD